MHYMKPTEKLHSSEGERDLFLSPTTSSRIHMATNTPRLARMVNAYLQVEKKVGERVGERGRGEGGGGG